MIYLTMLVSDLPVVPLETDAQRIYVRIEQGVPDGFRDFTVEQMVTYFSSVREVIEQDLNAMSTPIPVEPAEPQGSVVSQSGEQ